MGMGGQSVDAVDYLTEKIKGLDQKIEVRNSFVFLISRPNEGSPDVSLGTARLRDSRFMRRNRRIMDSLRLNQFPSLTLSPKLCTVNEDWVRISNWLLRYVSF